MTYMESVNQYSNFFNKADVAPVLASGLIGGSLYGGTYVGSKNLLGAELDPETTKQELIANSAAGTASGIGGYLITKALQRKM